MTELEVKLIKLDGGTQARAGTDRDTVNEYVEALRESDSTWPFPPVTVYHDGDAYWLADGFHRITAARQHGRFVCEADIRQGTQRDAILHAAGANADHGLRRTPEDKKRAVLRLLEDAEWGRWSDREIARRCRVSPTFVGGVRKELGTVHVDSMEERVFVHPKTGKPVTMNTAAIGGKPRPSNENLRKRLRQSLRDEMYATYQVTGITDAELRQVLSRDWGLGGGSSGPEMTAVYKKGGANPGFWYNNYRDSGKPTLSGRELITWVREVLELPYPQKETAVAPPQLRVGDRVMIIDGGWKGQEAAVLEVRTSSALIECQMPVRYLSKPSEIKPMKASVALNWLKPVTSLKKDATPGLFLNTPAFPDKCPIGRAEVVNGANCGRCIYYCYTARGTNQCEEPTWLKSKGVLNSEQTAVPTPAEPSPFYVGPMAQGPEVREALDRYLDQWPVNRNFITMRLANVESSGHDKEMQDAVAALGASDSAIYHQAMVLRNDLPGPSWERGKQAGRETAVPTPDLMTNIMADVDAYEANTMQLLAPAPRRADYVDPRLADLNTAIGIVTRLTADTTLTIDTVGPLARALGLMEDAKKALANRQAYAAWLRNYQDDDGRRWTDLSDNQTWHKNSPCYQAFVKAFPKEDFARSALMDAKQRLEQETAVSMEVNA